MIRSTRSTRSIAPVSRAGWLVTSTLALAAACAPTPGTADEEEAAPLDDGPAVGEDYAAPDVEPGADVDAAHGCGEDCDIPSPTDGGEVVEVAPEDPVAPSDDDAAPSPPTSEANGAALHGPVAGSTMITRRYAGFHRHPEDGSALLAVAPHGGVDPDGRHPSANPKGLIPPGKRVTLVHVAPQHGYLKVRFDGVTGWVKAAKLAWRDPSLSPVRFALQLEVRNAFFKHQISRGRWNKDGPRSSANCAPTSLAMAANVLGKERAGASVEQSIHRVRRLYDGGLHEGDGTTRGEIHEAARELGLHVRGLTSDLPPAAALERVNRQLAAGRLVILQGQPGRPHHGPTPYERAFTRAYRAAMNDGARLPHVSYDYDGRHSILVLGRDGNGRYVVGDPISEVGFVELSGGELKDFMTRFTGQRGTGNAVWR